MTATTDLARFLRHSLALLALLAFATVTHAAGIAMVTDLQGKATVAAADGKARDLTILSELDAGAKVQLAAGATLVALYLDAGDEYLFKGPSTIEFRAGGPEVPSGAKPEKRSLSLGKGGKDVRIRPVGVTQGAMVMRTVRPEARIQLLTLNKTHTLEASPEFRWSALQPGVTYGFELSDATGRILYDAKVDRTSLKLPPEVVLVAGAAYSWEVTARLPDGRKYSSSADFAVADATLRARADALRPPAAASLSTKVAYAAWLDTAELKDEARRYWKEAAAQRPDDARLKALAEP